MKDRTPTRPGLIKTDHRDCSYMVCEVCARLYVPNGGATCECCLQTADVVRNRAADIDLDALIAGRMADIGADEEVGS